MLATELLSYIYRICLIRAQSVVNVTDINTHKGVIWIGTLVLGIRKTLNLSVNLRSFVAGSKPSTAGEQPIITLQKESGEQVRVGFYVSGFIKAV